MVIGFGFFGSACLVLLEMQVKDAAEFVEGINGRR
jgi:hypothetical protein